MEKSIERSPVGESQVTGEMAVRIFENKFSPDRWLLRKQAPDYYIDYKVELLDKRHLSGKEFAAQVKGKRSKLSSVPRRQMKVEHLKYYLKLKIPVFIFLVDVDLGNVFWLFAHKYLKDEVCEKRLGQQKYVNVIFDPKDNFAEPSRFETAVQKAFVYVEELYPGSVEAAVRAKRERLEKLDPRLSVNIELHAGKEEIKIQAISPLELKGKFTADQDVALKALDAHRLHGEKVEIPIKNFKLEGSRLIDELGGEVKEALLTFLPTQRNGALQFEFKDEYSKSRLIQLDGLWRLGQESCTFECAFESSPFACFSKLSPTDFLQKKDVPLSMSFNWDAWAGKPIMNLPRFDEICALVDAFKTKRSIQMNWLLEGQFLCCAQKSENEEIQYAISTLLWISDCREIARLLKVFPKLPPTKELTEDIWKAIGILKTLLDRNIISSPCPHAPLTFPLKNPINHRLPDVTAKPSDFIVVGFREFDFLGHKVELRVKTVFSEMILTRVTSKSESITMYVEGTESSRQILSLDTDDKGNVIILNRETL